MENGRCEGRVVAQSGSPLLQEYLWALQEEKGVGPEHLGLGSCCRRLQGEAELGQWERCQEGEATQSSRGPRHILARAPFGP
jgi:hypothetical protein